MDVVLQNIVGYSTEDVSKMSYNLARLLAQSAAIPSLANERYLEPQAEDALGFGHNLKESLGSVVTDGDARKHLITQFGVAVKNNIENFLKRIDEMKSIFLHNLDFNLGS